MSEQIRKKSVIAKDTLIYMLAKGIEGIIGVLTISAMSYIYLPEEIGKYSTINIAITTISMVAIQWLVQSVLRYINKYDLENMKIQFYSTVFFSWLKVNLIVGLSFSFFILILVLGENIPIFNNILLNYPISLLIVSLLMFLTYNTSQLIIALLAGARKSKVNLILSVINVFGKLGALIIFNKLFSVKIEWLFLSYIIFDFITAFLGTINLKIFKYISLKEKSDEILSVFKIYGMPLMGNMLATSVLNKSDIYIITSFLGDDKAGIYQTNYSIIAATFTLISAGAMRGSYPTIVRTWSEGKKDMAQKLIGDAIRFYLLISVPAVFGIFVLSDYIAISLFEAKYFDGNSIMGFVGLGMLFLGLTEYANKPWELNAKTKEIFKRSMISGILNIILNLLLIKKFGYKFAGISTFLSFLIYFLLVKKGTKKYMKFNINKKSLFNIIISAFLMSFFILLIKIFLNGNIITLGALVIFGIIFYVIALYLSGEIKNELNSIIKKLFNK